MFKFNYPVDPKDRIVDYEKIILAEEREAVAAWAVQGFEQMRHQGAQFTIPQSHVEEMELVANRANSVLLFLKCLQQGEQILLGHEKHSAKTIISTSIDHLYSEYRNWCAMEANVLRVDSQSFQSRLEELQTDFGFQVKRGFRANGVPGVDLKFLTLAARKAA